MYSLIFTLPLFKTLKYLPLNKTNILTLTFKPTQVLVYLMLHIPFRTYTTTALSSFNISKRTLSLALRTTNTIISSNCFWAYYLSILQISVKYPFIRDVFPSQSLLIHSFKLVEFTLFQVSIVPFTFLFIKFIMLKFLVQYLFSPQWSINPTWSRNESLARKYLLSKWMNF